MPKYREQYRIVKGAHDYSVRSVVFLNNMPIECHAPIVSGKSIDEIKTVLYAAIEAFSYVTINDSDIPDNGDGIDS